MLVMLFFLIKIIILTEMTVLKLPWWSPIQSTLVFFLSKRQTKSGTVAKWSQLSDVIRLVVVRALYIYRIT